MNGLLLDDVQAVSLQPVEWYEGKLAERGIRVTTLAHELAVDPNAWEKLRDANQAAQSGWLDPGMVRVNEKFGFRRTYVEVRLVRRPV